MTDDPAIFRELSLAQRKSMPFFPFFAAFSARGLGRVISADPVGCENRVTAQENSEPDRWNRNPSKSIRGGQGRIRHHVAAPIEGDKAFYLRDL
jgi:hypothetical protein